MQFQLTFLLQFGLLSYAKAEDECNRGACHPAGDLLVRLMASSTCGLDRAHKYCLLGYGEQKCFIDCRFPHDPHSHPNNHHIENVIASFEADREKKWWQSENGLDYVSIRLVLEALFQFSHLVLSFKVHGWCVCQHNTDGLNCERCKDFFQDTPWRLAAGPQDSICSHPSPFPACSCNSHSDRCRFDMVAYLDSGGVSGGVCEDCQHHAEGQHCHHCRPLVYKNQHKAILDPYACLPCECDPDGTISGSISVSYSDPALGSVADQCLCKENMEGVECDQEPHHCGLSATDRLGCKPCNCNPLGSLPLSSCDVEDTGHCVCPFATGPHCEAHMAEYWGLESHVHGCCPCDCDIGGAYSNVCSPRDGQCECAVPGRTCSEPAPGYFFAPLNFYVYKAKEAIPPQGLSSLGPVSLGQVPAVHIVFQEPVPGMPVTWTGPGFARVFPGAGLRFAVSNIPSPMDFSVAICYAIQVSFKSSIFSGEKLKIVLLPTPICLEPDVQHSIDVCSQPLEGASHTHSHILVDSRGLLPQINALEAFCSKPDLDEYQLYTCVEIALELRAQVLPGVCERLTASMSARLHNGTVVCKCHPEGSVGTNCSLLGGQCQCKPHVTGCCDISAGSYGLGRHGCHSCHCHLQGSSTVCDQITGQCPCQLVAGRHCDRCLQGYFGFPNHRPCLCNGFAELCDQTGSCFSCGGFTTGRNCERCIDGYYGNLSSGQPCHPWPCPDVPTSNQYFAHSCYQNPWNSDILCNCHQGYAGGQCEECSAGFYGNPGISGVPCQPWAYNSNTDVTDPESRSRVTGECLKCLHNTQGPSCTPGHFGSALNQTCKNKCSCHPSGVNTTDCPPGQGACLCDPDTGTCACLPSVTGRICDRCADGSWNLVPGRGCQPCDCAPQTHGTHYDKDTGQCLCKLGYGGKRSSECWEGYYAAPLGPSCDCHREGTEKPMCDDTSMCHCQGVSGQCDHCARGHSQEFPACPRCHLCFDQWDHSISSFSRAVQGLKLTANVEDKRETLLVCEADFKGLRENKSEIERILKYPIFSSREFLNVKDYHDSVRRFIMKLSEQLKTVYEFQDLKEKMRKESDLLLENIQEKIDLYSSAHNASIVVFLIEFLFLFLIKNISNLAEVSKNDALQLSEKLYNMKNQNESEEEKMKLLIKKLKSLTYENVPPEDIEKSANHALDIHLPRTSQNLTHESDRIQKCMRLCEDCRTDEDKLNKEAQKILVKAEHTEKAANVLLNLNKMLNTLQQVQVTEGRANSIITQLTAEITKMKKNALQTENQVKETKNELDLAKQQSTLEDGLSLLQIKLRRNQEQAIHVESGSLGPTRRQAGGLEEKFIELKNQYAIFQHKTSRTRLTKEMLGKVKLLRDAVQKLAGDTEDKIRRTTDLEKKIQELNLSRQEKADQLKQLEDQVIAVKNEIVEQENKYNCKVRPLKYKSLCLHFRFLVSKPEELCELGEHSGRPLQLLIRPRAFPPADQFHVAGIWETSRYLPED
ncbi:LOW QUALITY PROTEIN: laminin subunit beta-4 [Rhynchonycteris naso]